MGFLIYRQTGSAFSDKAASLVVARVGGGAIRFFMVKLHEVWSQLNSLLSDPDWLASTASLSNESGWFILSFFRSVPIVL